jgi:hypothetical protein
MSAHVMNLQLLRRRRRPRAPDPDPRSGESGTPHRPLAGSSCSSCTRRLEEARVKAALETLLDRARRRGRGLHGDEHADRRAADADRRQPHTASHKKRSATPASRAGVSVAVEVGRDGTELVMRLIGRAASIRARSATAPAISARWDARSVRTVSGTVTIVADTRERHTRSSAGCRGSFPMSGPLGRNPHHRVRRRRADRQRL